ncbi:hypothetical protein [Bosea lathyri]|uniref:Uncharacterized protein n=1 Tax=Bosea lathyri TaxID=1036778 RepID=A0A1H5W9J0_9HYPH|nr:hypothetical protein [Bosea lathyri]SEF95861.1 hypothetical protein SAMN04488115_102597 [Bosea lathyri]
MLTLRRQDSRQIPEWDRAKFWSVLDAQFGRWRRQKAGTEPGGLG